MRFEEDYSDLEKIYDDEFLSLASERQRLTGCYCSGDFIDSRFTQYGEEEVRAGITWLDYNGNKYVACVDIEDSSEQHFINQGTGESFPLRMSNTHKFIMF